MSKEQSKPELGKKFEAAFNEGLRELRKQFPSDNELAKHTGISQPTISKMLLGTQEPRLTAVSRILDSAGAEVIFPWSKRNETRRIAMEGFSGKAEDWRAVSRFEVKDGKVLMLEEGGVVLPLSTLMGLSPALSLGVFRMPGDVQFGPGAPHTGDDVLVDFSKKVVPGERSAYLAISPDGTLACAHTGVVVASSGNRDDGRNMLIFATGKEVRAILLNEDGSGADDFIIGKIVYVMGAMRI